MLKSPFPEVSPYQYPPAAPAGTSRPLPALPMGAQADILSSAQRPPNPYAVPLPHQAPPSAAPPSSKNHVPPALPQMPPGMALTAVDHWRAIGPQPFGPVAHAWPAERTP